MKRTWREPGTRGRRRLRLMAGVSAALAVLVAWNQSGLLPVGALGGDGPSAGSSRVVSRSSVVGGLDALSVQPPPDESAVAPAPPPPPAIPDPEPEPATPAPAAPAKASVTPVRDVAIAPPPATFGGTVAPPPPPAKLPPSRYDSRTAVGGTWALIIGINDYPGVRYDLRSAVNDANDVNDALSKLGVTNDRRMVLRDGQAGADTIRAALDWLTAHAGPGSTIVLFYAGHVQRLDAGREVLVGSDGGIIPDTEVAAMLDRSPAERAWVTIAACYGGGFDEVLRPGRILTAAAPSDQVAYENEAFGRSYLVEYMIRRAILGQGFSTVEGAFAWAMAELQRDYPNRLPVQLDAVGGDFELRVGPPPPSPSAPPPGPSGGGQAPPSEPPEDGCSALTVDVVRCS